MTWKLCVFHPVKQHLFPSLRTHHSHERISKIVLLGYQRHWRTFHFQGVSIDGSLVPRYCGPTSAGTGDTEHKPYTRKTHSFAARHVIVGSCLARILDGSPEENSKLVLLNWLSELRCGWSLKNQQISDVPCKEKPHAAWRDKALKKKCDWKRQFYSALPWQMTRCVQQ